MSPQLFLFRLLMAALIQAAPAGTTGCNAPLDRATVCWIEFQNPVYLEYLYPTRPYRLAAVLEMAQAGLIDGD